jgi:hypothetical protein
MSQSGGKVTLERGDFFELLYRLRTVELLTVEAREKMAAAEAKKRSVFDAMAVKYGLDPSATYDFDADACALTPRG